MPIDEVANPTEVGTAELVASQPDQTIPKVESSALVTVSLDVVWEGSTGMQDARMSEISMEGCFIDDRVQGRSIGDRVAFKAHLPEGPWISLQGDLVEADYPMGFSLRFNSLTEGDKRLLREVVIAHGGHPGDNEPAPVPKPSEIAAQPAALVPAIMVEADTLIPAALTEVSKADPPDTRSRVLIADDDPLTLRMLSAIVESEGYRAITAADGREALRCLQQEPGIKAAIFDMSMPYLQGLDLILFMKADERLRGIPVGMITAERDPKVWDDSVAAGASVFLPKPFTPPQVAMLLRMLASKAGSL